MPIDRDAKSPAHRRLTQPAGKKTPCARPPFTSTYVPPRPFSGGTKPCAATYVGLKSASSMSRTKSKGVTVGCASRVVAKPSADTTWSIGAPRPAAAAAAAVVAAAASSKLHTTVMMRAVYDASSDVSLAWAMVAASAGGGAGRSGCGQLVAVSQKRGRLPVP